MEQSRSWEANRFSASQEILPILWNPTVRYRTHKCPPPVHLMEPDGSLPYPQVPATCPFDGTRRFVTALTSARHLSYL
jgi:hypothetical protein